MKKIVFTLLFLLMCCPIITLAEETNTYYINDNGVSMTKQQYKNLQDQGFTQFEIQNIPQNEFDKRKDISAELVATVDSYYKMNYKSDGTVDTVAITENEYQLINEKQKNSYGTLGLSPGYVETLALKLSTTLSKQNSNYLFKATMDTKTIPPVRNYDIIGIAFNDSKIRISSSTIGEYETTCMMTQDGCMTGSYGAKKTFSMGVGYAYKLNSSLFVKSISTTLYYEVYKATTATITELNAYGWYSRSTSESIDAIDANEFILNIAGITFDKSSLRTKFENLPGPSHLNWTGQW